MQKKEKIQKMFASISRRYDFLNCLLSLGMDRQWRRFAASKLPGGLILDVCSGTGDVAIEVSKNHDVVASDFCYEMLEICSNKLSSNGIINVRCIQNDAENLSFKNDTFDGAVVAFGIRNISDIRKALSEMHRVVKKGGRVVVLEFSKPTNPFFRTAYYFYFKKILPFIGRIVSKKEGAYSYLPSSVMAFPERDEFSKLMEEADLSGIEYHDLTFGIVTVYRGTK